MQLKGYVTDLVFQIIGKNWNLEVLLWTFSVAVTTSLKVLPDKRDVQIFIVCLHDQKYFLVIFPRFKRIITIKNPFEPPSGRFPLCTFAAEKPFK